MLAGGSGFGSDAEGRIARSSGLGHGWSGTSGSYPTGTSGCRVYSPRVVVAHDHRAGERARHQVGLDLLGAQAQVMTSLSSPSHRGCDNPCMRILIVEDEAKMASLLRRGLGEEGHSADIAGTGEEALWMARAVEYDAIVLDLMLPGIDGVEVCKRLRADAVWSPVLMLTARTTVGDRVAGLDSGADDYLAKPFAFEELLARLRALARREVAERPNVLAVGDLSLDPASREVHRGETSIALSAKEFALLETFMRRPGRVLSRFDLLEHAWDGEYENRSNVVDVYIGYLRDKIDRPFGRDSIETVRGAGYRLRAAPR